MQQSVEKNLALLAKRVKTLRLAKSKSLNRFVFERGGITTATWSRIENGKFNLKFSTLLLVAAMLEINVCELLHSLDFDYTIED